MNELYKVIKQFNVDRDWDQFHSPEHLIKSISIEAAELLECVQWDSNFDLDCVKDELADVLIYAFQLALKLDLDVKDIMLKKMDKNAEKYPIEAAKGKSLKYDKL